MQFVAAGNIFRNNNSLMHDCEQYFIYTLNEFYKLFNIQPKCSSTAAVIYVKYQPTGKYTSKQFAHRIKQLSRSFLMKWNYCIQHIMCAQLQLQLNAIKKLAMHCTRNIQIHKVLLILRHHVFSILYFLIILDFIASIVPLFRVLSQVELLFCERFCCP